MRMTIAVPRGPAWGDALMRSEAARTALVRLPVVAGHDLEQPLQVALMAAGVATDGAGRGDGAGLGVGLPIVCRTARALEVPVGVRPAPGRGSGFGVSLPRADHEGPDAPDA
ncbi:hypothetical protein [Methylobacterium frigidaeris]|jgi:hypothetical protein|uniref:Histidine kinase n=1 Tax=Methylobacterium frigidaeris TaxID=2038277 RepID=A0AA37M2T1_9HYPH|nr:hypothetical protein [Methylobacterium frigidaeris]PIK72745.1 hypothetical protein CS379_12280 [Methylobacterium frigidaeris]GJD60863.1 hypothetical protein MPEAHAMD_1003 [Methylobacterium frigidaeris]